MTEWYMEKYNNWLENPRLTAELRLQLEAIKDHPQEIEERFYKDLEFGTGGLRGILGAGTNRMNIYTVSKASQGLANYINKQIAPEKEKSVVIAYDNRHKSKEFAQQAGLVLAKNNIKAYVFEAIAPTPLLSYAVCKLRATAGIVVTASHNPKEYNGFKVYWSHGGQITDHHANAIISQVMKISDELSIEALDESLAIQNDLFQWLDDGLLNSYLTETSSVLLNKELIEKEGHHLSIVFTPLHGTGAVPVIRVLKENGFSNLKAVTAQCLPDPEFSTVLYPNPEEEAAFELALSLGKKVNADIIMGTDPDADRLGVIVKDQQQKYVILTGNQMGALLIDYLLEMKKASNSLPPNGVIIKTIVTSTMGVDIAASHGVKSLDVLTGFKYIGEKVAEFAQSQEYSFLFGYEESYGFLAGDYVRDKDAVQIALLASEMALYYKLKGICLNQRLQQLFQIYGYYQEDLINISLSGIEGQKRIVAIIDHLRASPPLKLINQKITLIKDYWTSVENCLLSNQQQKIDLPKSNVIHYTLEDGTWFCIRPSGTEPKLKIYLGVKETDGQRAEDKITQLKETLIQLIDEI